MNWLNWPNRISIARTLFVIPFIYFLCQMPNGGDTWRHLALITFVVMALSDVVDGYLARKWGQESAIGAFLDPMADKILVTAGVILLTLESTSIPGFRIPWWVCAVAIGKDVVTITGFSLILIGVRAYFVQPRMLGKLSTTLQSVMIAFCLVAPDLPGGLVALWPAAYSLATLAAIAATVDYLRLGIVFARRASETREERQNAESPKR
ncbi:MAG: CDP-alcohol phosphatidyltransferase family protein [Phycisphaerae bacterium]